MAKYLLIAACSYLLGSLSFAVIVSKLTIGRDIRDFGSGNAGLTNAYRTMGAGKTLLVLAGDILKAVAALMIGGALCGSMGKLVAGAFVILGHVFPLYFGFRGGKGVLVGAVFLLLLDWRCFLIALTLFLVAVLLTRWISLGSILGAASFPFSMYWFYRDIPLTIVAACMGGAVIFFHRSNIGRILQGKENKFSFHSNKTILDDKGDKK